MADPRAEAHLIPPGGGLPNNPRLPLLVYRGVLGLAGDPAYIEQAFAALTRQHRHIQNARLYYQVSVSSSFFFLFGAKLTFFGGRRSKVSL